MNKRVVLSQCPRTGDAKWRKGLVRSTVFTIVTILLFIGMPHQGTAFGKGSQGADVYVIQGMLKSLGSYSGEINGQYDNVTASGVMHFQKTHGLPVTGVVDNRTFKSIHYAYVKHKFPTPRRWNGGGKWRPSGNGAGESQGEGVLKRIRA
ncbi:peptidoglycan-binding domain-containing protein [Paenibacillus sp. 1001270B_150601_E10]|uniref:peptidoglycan-binding domain-containing protein n=1 Tax=Paenibacillus sp. 1001270B_150601_E10 TaxID=2787079 RepID=UPI001E29A7B9|nr:peptidoglycan-binding domain-containing protein [Paenibacillus sp. 1001270B_150601_E10]